MKSDLRNSIRNKKINETFSKKRLLKIYDDSDEQEDADDDEENEIFDDDKKEDKDFDKKL